MITLRTTAFVAIATKKGWIHASGRLRGTVNIAAAARAVGVVPTTLGAAYDGAEVGTKLISHLMKATGLPFEQLFDVVVEPASALAS